MNAIEITNLSKKFIINHENTAYLTLRDKLFGKKKQKKEIFFALKDINLKIKKGETVGIIGDNGSGKSTLLKIVARVIYPTEGKIAIAGKVASILEVGVGFHTELTGKENIYFYGATLGMSKTEIDKKYKDIVEFSGVENFLDMPVKHYSSGMYMRLAFSVVVHLEHDILLIDEVLAVGDFKFQKKCLEKMEEIGTETGRTIIFVSHNLQAVKRLCSKCVMLKNGNIEKIGETDEVIRSYENYKKNTFDLVERRQDRRGTGRARIVNVFLKDKEGGNIYSFNSGQDVYFWFEYKIFDSSIKELDFALPINNYNDGIRLGHIYTKTVKQKICVNGPSNFIILRIDKLPLNVGEYSYNIWLESSGELLDWVVNAGTFKVEHGSFYKTNLLPPHNQGNVLFNYEFLNK